MTHSTEELEAVEIAGRLVIGGSSAIMLLIIVVGSIIFKVHTAPGFVRNQVILLGLCNLGGLVMSCSLLKKDFYDSVLTFSWQSFWITLYFGGNLLSGWFFAYRYLITSRMLTVEVRKSRDRFLMYFNLGDKTESLIEQSEEERYRDGCCRNGSCFPLKCLKCYSCYWMSCLCCVTSIWIFSSAFTFGCYEQGDSEEAVPRDCNTIEDWLGNLSDLTILTFASIWLRIGIVIVFGVALCRIGCLVEQLKMFGYVSSTKVLNIHIVVSVVDLMLNLIMGVWTFTESLEAVVVLESKNDPNYKPPDSTKAVSALMIQQIYQVPNQLLILVVIYHVLKYMGRAQEDQKEADEGAQSSSEDEQIEEEEDKALLLNEEPEQASQTEELEQIKPSIGDEDSLIEENEQILEEIPANMVEQEVQISQAITEQQSLPVIEVSAAQPTEEPELIPQETHAQQELETQGPQNESEDKRQSIEVDAALPKEIDHKMKQIEAIAASVPQIDEIAPQSSNPNSLDEDDHEQQEVAKPNLVLTQDQNTLKPDSAKTKKPKITPRASNDGEIALENQAEPMSGSRKPKTNVWARAKENARQKNEDKRQKKRDQSQEKLRRRVQSQALEDLSLEDQAVASMFIQNNRANTSSRRKKGGKSKSGSKARTNSETSENLLSESTKEKKRENPLTNSKYKSQKKIKDA